MPQLIQVCTNLCTVPWALYNLSRPRRPVRTHVQESADAKNNEKDTAASELRSLEFFFLSLTVISPLLGAFILRHAATTILGTDAVSWFSTRLFVLATVIRPWKHLVERFQQRVVELHDLIHYPPSSFTASEDAQARMEEMAQRVGELERSLSKFKVKVSNITEDIYDYVDDAMQGMDKTFRRHEKKCDATRGSQEMHL